MTVEDKQSQIGDFKVCITHKRESVGYSIEVIYSTVALFDRNETRVFFHKYGGLPERAENEYKSTISVLNSIYENGYKLEKDEP